MASFFPTCYYICLCVYIYNPKYNPLCPYNIACMYFFLADHLVNKQLFKSKTATFFFNSLNTGMYMRPCWCWEDKRETLSTILSWFLRSTLYDFLKFIFNTYMSMHVFVHVWVGAETRGRCQVSWSWGHRILSASWCLCFHLSCSSHSRAVSAFNHWAISVMFMQILSMSCSYKGGQSLGQEVMQLRDWHSTCQSKELTRKSAAAWNIATVTPFVTLDSLRKPSIDLLC